LCLFSFYGIQSYFSVILQFHIATTFGNDTFGCERKIDPFLVMRGVGAFI